MVPYGLDPPNFRALTTNVCHITAATWSLLALEDFSSATRERCGRDAGFKPSSVRSPAKAGDVVQRLSTCLPGMSKVSDMGDSLAWHSEWPQTGELR